MMQMVKNSGCAQKRTMTNEKRHADLSPLTEEMLPVADAVVVADQHDRSVEVGGGETGCCPASSFVQSSARSPAAHIFTSFGSNWPRTT